MAQAVESINLVLEGAESTRQSTMGARANGAGAAAPAHPRPAIWALGVAFILACLALGITYFSSSEPAPIQARTAPAPAPAQTAQPQLASVAPAPVVPLREPATVEPGAAWKGSVPAGTRVRVSNGTGRPQMAGRFAKYFAAHGLSVQLIRNANSFDYPRTVIFYNPDQRDTAFALAASLPFPVRMAEAKVGRGEIEFVLGADVISIDETLKSAA